MSSEQQQQQQHTCWLDGIQLPMNACSLETLYTPLPLLLQQQQQTTSTATTHDLNIHVHPLVIGCYQLNETSSNGNNNYNDIVEEEEEEDKEQQQEEKEEQHQHNEHDEYEHENNSSPPSRSGELLLYTIKDNDMKFHQDRVQIVKTGDGSGVLDGKWLQNGLTHHTGDTGSNRLQEEEHCFLYATANASGSIHLYKLEPQDALSNDSSSSSSDGSGYRLRHVAASESNANDHGLALSLAWDESTTFNLDHDDSNASTVDFHSTTTTTTRRIISSYSKGSLALHDVHFKRIKDNNDNNHDDPMIVLEESQRWNAHTMFGCPSEVWTTCFTTNRHSNTYSHSVLSGGDDCKMKLWDLRTSCDKPMHVHDDFEAGVTAVAYHPFLEHVFAVGSYDEKIRIWDMRKLGGGGGTSRGRMPTMEDCAHDVGGGVWRIKWHPLDASRMLVGAMHGGCRVLQIEGLQSSSRGANFEDGARIDIQTVKEFREHKSMAYGADWIVSRNSHTNTHVEAAASCSFYDKAAFIWNAK